MRTSIPVMRVFIIAATVLIWANVVAFTTKTQTITLPIQVEGLAPGTAVAQAMPEVSINLSGRAIDIAKVNENNLIFVINLNNSQAGEEVNASVNLKAPLKGINVLSYEPHSLQLAIERETTKLLPVVVEPVGMLADGFAITNAVVDPGSVTISGSPTLLGQVSEVVVEVSVTRRRKTFTVPVIPKALLGKNLHPANLTITPNPISATLTIEKGSATRNLGVKATFDGELPAGFFLKEVQFDPPVVSITGNQRVIGALANLISTPIKLTSRDATFSEQVSLDLPTGVKVVGENLINARVIIERSEISREFNISPEFINVTEGFGVTAITPRSIKVVVVGEEAVLANLKRTDIKLNVDLQRLLTGSNQIPLTAGMFNLPAGVGVGSFTPDTIEVILSRL